MYEKKAKRIKQKKKYIKIKNNCYSFMHIYPGGLAEDAARVNLSFSQKSIYYRKKKFAKKKKKKEAK